MFNGAGVRPSGAATTFERTGVERRVGLAGSVVPAAVIVMAGSPYDWLSEVFSHVHCPLPHRSPPRGPSPPLLALPQPTASRGRATSARRERCTSPHRLRSGACPLREKGLE